MEFRILGPLEIAEGDRRLTCKGAKQRLLLGVLLLHPNEVVSSDRLIEALWGERPPETAPKALQMHVSQLRKLLEPDRSPGGSGRVLRTRPPGYELRLEPGQLDLERFETALSEARVASAAGRSELASRTLREALALWRGPALADLGFEDFLQPEIARLEELHLAALEERIDADLTLGRHAEVIGELEGLATEHPVRERLRGQLMLALYRSGRQAEALDAYRDARRVLVDELGIEPSKRLRDLHSAMLAQDPSLDARAQAVAPRRRAAAYEGLVGREDEMAELLPLVSGALAGDCALILLGGEPGIGKSRLAEALAGHADEAGADVLVGRCWEAGGAPSYWPWVQAMRSYVRGRDRAALRAQVGRDSAELATILPELRELVPDLPAPQASASDGARFRLFQSVASFLRGAATVQPLALFLDDLHAADAPSLLVLRFLAGQLDGTPILIVGCYRDTEVGPDLADALVDLSREPSVHRLALRGLGSSGTSRLLELTTGRALADDLAVRIHAETHGNPLFAAEIGRLLASERSLDRVGDRLPIPEGVRETIARRVRRRSETCREVLALASVLGREFPVDALERVARLDEDELFGALDEAASARLVGGVPGASGRLRFSHMLVRDALYEDLPAPRRRRLHRAIAGALEELHAGNPEPHVAELAHHYLEAGSSAARKAMDYSSRAGNRAASQHGYEEAARHYSSALRVLDATGTDDAQQRCRLLLSLGEALSRAGSALEAKQALRRAAEMAEAEGWTDQLARAAVGYGGRFGWARASTDPVLVPLLERALAAVGKEDSRARVRLLARLAAAKRDHPFRDRRVVLGREAVKIATRIGDPATLAHALEGEWVAVEGPDATGAGVAVGARLVELGEQIGDKEQVFQGHDHRLNSFWKQADRAGVEVEIGALAVLAEELRQPAHRWHVGTARTMLALMEGRFEQAERLIDETLDVGQRAQSWNAVVSQRLQLFVLRREQGRLAEIEDTMRRSVHEYPTLLRFRCALAHLCAELDEERDARAALDRILSHDLTREYVDAEWPVSMSLLPDTCALLGDGDAAARVYAVLLPYERLYAEAPVEISFGSLARGLGVLATTLHRFDEAERHFGVAIETEQRMRARPWLAHAQHDLATMLLERDGAGDAERAGALLDEAVAAYRDLGMETWAARGMALGAGAAGA